MKGFLSHYTPSLMNPEDLDAIFVQRQPLLTDLLENIENSILTEAKHHALLIGPRGIGKTHLISMIYHRVSANEVFQDKLKIAWLREEEWGVATFLDLLVRILNSLMEEYKDSNLEEQVKGLYSVSTEQAEQLAGHILKQYCQDKTLLLLMENLDEIFKGLDESGQQAFRAYLQNYGFITIVATSQSLFKGVQSRNLPFYGFFSPTHLKPLVLEEAIALLVNIAKWRGDQGDQDLANSLITPLGKSRIRAIHHLAGGNHRIYIIFSQFLTTESLDSLVEPFMKTLDDLIPFYQSRMQFISPQQRKIIEYLCEQRGAIAVKEIAQHCFISPQTASSQLKQLREMGYVYADAQGRESFYELQEPLMRICLETKKRRGTPNQLFISFLRVWFSRQELENRLEILPLEAIFDRECTRLALAEMEVSDDPKITALLREWDDAKNNSQYQKMLEIADQLILIRNSGMDWIKKADTYYQMSRWSDSIQALTKAIKIEPLNTEIWELSGNRLYFLKLLDESLYAYEQSIRLNPNNYENWSFKAFLEIKLNKHKEALISIQKAIDLSKEDSEIIERSFFIFDAAGNIDKLTFYVDKLLEKEPNNGKALGQKSQIFMYRNNYDKALDCINKAIYFNPYSSLYYRILAMIQTDKGDYKKALDSINYAISLNNSDSQLLSIKGIIFLKMEYLIDAVKCFGSSLNYEIIFFSNIITNAPSIQPIILRGLQTASYNILSSIFQTGSVIEQWRKDCQEVFTVYLKCGVINFLSGGLVESIKVINEPNVSEHTAQAWLEMWQNLAGEYDEFQVALNLLKVAVEYKINRDRRVLLQLPQEERQILEELLNPETI